MIGVLILLAMMATAFMGYVLPWGQMSFWGATVITNLFSAIPWVGDDIVTLLWAPQRRQPVAEPVLLAALSSAVRDYRPGSAAHRCAAPAWFQQPNRHRHEDRSSSVPFHPYYTVKDLFGLGARSLIFFAFFVFFAPKLFREADNYIPADALQTPAHIVPEWYILRRTTRSCAPSQRIGWSITFCRWAASS